LITSILGKEWKPTNSIEDIINLIPSFCERVLENNNNKYLLYYGDYFINEVYDINYFTSNSELILFKCIQFLKCKSPNNNNKQKKERFIILTDVYFLLFEPAINYKNLAKLIFWGDIRNMSISKTDNYHETEKAHSYNLDWINENQKIISMEILFSNFFINSNFLLNPIQDFIDAVEKKSNKLKDNFRVFQEDYFKPYEVINNTNSNLENLSSLIKYNENKFSLYKSSFLAKNLILLYTKMYSYCKKLSDPNAENFENKIRLLANNKEYDNKVTDNYELKFNIKNNYGLSRSYSNTYHEDFI